MSFCIVSALAGACGEPLEADSEAASEPAALLAASIPEIGDVTLVGTGCSAADIATPRPVAVANGQTFMFEFKNFRVLVDPRTPEPIKQLDCTIDAEIRAPEGIQYALMSVSTAARVFLEKDVKAEVNVMYSLDGVPASIKTTDPSGALPPGPLDKPYHKVTDYLNTSEMVWSPCNATHGLRARIRLKVTNSDPKRTGEVAINYTDAHLSALEVGMTSRRCTATP